MFALIAFVAVTKAQIVPQIVPISAKGTDAEFNAHPQYHFEYSVNDPITGDAKSQQESRDGDVVQGTYSLVEADGTLRTVEYTADAVSGFNAVVSRSGSPVAQPVAPASIPIVTSKLAPATVLKTVPATTPLIKTAAAAPVYSVYSYPKNYNTYPYAYSRYPSSVYPYSGYPYSAYPYRGYSAPVYTY